MSYRALKRRFSLDDEYLDDVKTEIIHAKRLALDENGLVLVWTGNQPFGATVSEPPTKAQIEPRSVGTASNASDGERRQLTVMFCDLVGSTSLSEQFDPEELT